MEYTTADEFDVQPERRSKRHEHSSDDASATTLGNDATTRLLQQGGPSVMRKAAKSQGSGPLDPEIASEIQSSRGSGQALDDGTKADMEGQFGVDFSNVRVHADGRGDQLSRSVEAEAFTTGTDVFFRSGRYQPESTDGRKLLAHELTHVVQQSSGQVAGAGEVSHPDDAHEVEARNVADTVTASPVAAGVDRQETEEPVVADGVAGIDREEADELEADDATGAAREAAAPEEEADEETE